MLTLPFRSRGRTPGETEQVTEGFDFGHWVRTGRLIRIDPRWGVREVKFNPNHDPRDGRFTFAGGGGAVGMSRPPSKLPQVGREEPRIVADEERRRQLIWKNDPRNPRNHTAYVVRPGDTLTKIATTRVGITPADLEWLNGLDSDRIKGGQVLKIPTQAFRDEGKRAFDTYNALTLYRNSHEGALPPDAAHPPSVQEQLSGTGRLRPIAKNGYTFGTDAIDRTHEAKGDLYLADTSERSRTNQQKAGGADRRVTDDGGHFIAARFGGPTDSFNNFAQDANFNRGEYRAIEDSWAQSIRSGKHVHVVITAQYSGISRRPDSLTVRSVVDGRSSTRILHNEPKGRFRGR